MRTVGMGLLVLSWIFTSACHAQKDDLNYAEQKAILSSSIELLKAHYVFPERLDSLERAIAANYSKEACERLRSLDAFLEQWNLDLARWTNDRHLKISVSPKMVKQLRKEAMGHAEPPVEEYIQMLKNENFRMRKLEILDGNVGYFRIDNFVELKYCRETLVGAMNFISNSSAIVLDLTECGGGASETSDFIISYFLPESTKIGELGFRKDHETKIHYSARDTAMKDLSRVPLFIMVSPRTASAAEAVAFVLQQYKRATIIGEQTAGKANPGELFVINDDLYMFVTTAVSKSPVTGTNIDGIGVTPDFLAPFPGAFYQTMYQACLSLSKSAKDKRLRDMYQWSLYEYDALLNPQTPSSNLIISVAGPYEGHQAIVNLNGDLYFDNGTRKRKLTYLGNGVFSVDGRKDYRIYFPHNDIPIRYMKILWYDNTEDKISKLN